jgi:hypothetical protein
MILVTDIGMVCLVLCFTRDIYYNFVFLYLWIHSRFNAIAEILRSRSCDAHVSEVVYTLVVYTLGCFILGASDSLLLDVMRVEAQMDVQDVVGSLGVVLLYLMVWLSMDAAVNCIIGPISLIWGPLSRSR